MKKLILVINKEDLLKTLADNDYTKTFFYEKEIFCFEELLPFFEEAGYSYGSCTLNGFRTLSGTRFLEARFELEKNMVFECYFPDNYSEENFDKLLYFNKLQSFYAEKGFVRKQCFDVDKNMLQASLEAKNKLKAVYPKLFPDQLYVYYSIINLLAEKKVVQESIIETMLQIGFNENSVTQRMRAFNDYNILKPVIVNDEEFMWTFPHLTKMQIADALIEIK